MTELGFDTFDTPGNSTSSGTFTALLKDVVVQTITSTLQIQRLDNLNESSLTCAGVPSSGDPEDRMITVTVSGES